jgi:hypothetical protein
MDFINPQGFFIKGVKPQGEAYEKTEKKGKNFFSF